jgi:hypothetical protein
MIDILETVGTDMIGNERIKVKCHGFMKILPAFLGDYEIKYFTKQIT